MRITAAIVRNAGKPFSIETVELEKPCKDEVLVRVVAAGLSHADLLAREQDLPVPLPAVIGREGAGRVERVGSTVTRLGPGDHVILTSAVDALEPNLSGSRSDGSPTLRRGEERVSGLFFGHNALRPHRARPLRSLCRSRGLERRHGRATRRVSPDHCRRHHGEPAPIG